MSPWAGDSALALIGPMHAIDHIFICCAVGAPEAETLVRAGLSEGSGNTHPGQGTACRRFFFHNAYLELLWVSDLQEASSQLTRPTRLLERWHGRQGAASPFGIAIRPADAQGAAGPPFATWSYAPGYLPPGLAVEMATNAPLGEPEMFYIRFGGRPDQARVRQPLEHAFAVSELTRVTITAPPAGTPSPASAALARAGLVSFVPGDLPLLELGFDGELRGDRLDLRPTLPLLLRR